MKGAVDPITGMVMNLDTMKTEMQRVIDTVDHKFLDKDVPFFDQNPSTVENITIFFWEGLVSSMPDGVVLEKVKVYETDKNYAVYKG